MNKDALLFYLARVIGLAFRPLLIWLLLDLDLEKSNRLAQYFYVVASTFVFFNTGTHLNFYKVKFTVKSSGVKYIRSLKQYLVNLIGHISIMSIPLFITLYFLLENVFLATCFLIFALQEKIWDEIQRYQIFLEEYIVWAKWFVIKTITILCAVIVSVGFDHELMFPLTGFLIIFYLLLILKYQSSIFKVYYIFSFLASSFKSYKATILNYTSHGFYNQLLSIGLANMMLVDKWLIEKSVHGDNLSKIVFIGQCSSVFLVLVDNIYFTTNRKKYLSEKFNIRVFLNWNKFIFLSISFFLLSLIILNYLKIFLRLGELTVFQIGLCMLPYVIFGLSKPFSEVMYWNNSIRKQAIIEISILAIMAIIGYVLLNQYGMESMYLSLSVIMLLRVLYYFVLTDGVAVEKN